MAHHIAAWLGIPAGVVIAAMVILRKKARHCAPAASKPVTPAGQHPESGQAAHKPAIGKPIPTPD